MSLLLVVAVCALLGCHLDSASSHNIFSLLQSSTSVPCFDTSHRMDDRAYV